MADFSITEGMGTDVLWIVILGFLTSFILAIALGANDVANSFGTSVGAKVLTLGQACIIAAIFETLGALIIGSRVSETIRKGLFDPVIYTGNEELLMVGNLCALIASCTWLFIATWLKLPVSASHSVVGATLGYHIVVFADAGVDWYVVVKIALSWIISPLLSGIISGIIFTVIKYTIINKKDPLTPGLISLPIWYWVVMFVNLFAIVFGSPYIDESIAWWVSLLSGFGVGILVAVIVYFFLVPRTKQKIMDDRAALETERIVQKSLDPPPTSINQDLIAQKLRAKSTISEINIPMTIIDENEITKIADEPNGIIVPNPQDPIVVQLNGTVVVKAADSVSIQGTVVSTQPLPVKGKMSETWQKVKDSPEVHSIMSPLQVLSASFAAFSHGGNDVSNAIGPLVSLWSIYQTGMASQEANTEYWILLYGAAGITIGLFALGRRVIETVGEDLTPMTPSNGFSIELGSATTVLIASNLGIPVSTTHCKVGSVCAVGWLRSREAVDWRLFSGIFLAWIVTLPASIMLSAALMGLLQHTVTNYCTCVPFELMTTAAMTAMTTV